MYAVEINNLTKSFKGLHAVDNLSMHVPVGSIYGFIGENGSGKSTTMKLICGHLVASSGEIKLFGKKHSDPGVRVRIGALIENAGCFPSSSIYDNLMMQAINLGLENREEEILRVLKTVRMEDNLKMKFKNCSLGMKQRVGIAMALLGNPALLILDEPINGLDADGMKLMREILTDITKNEGVTVLITSHVLGELEKIATHYGIIRQGKMIKEISASEMDKRNQSAVLLKTEDLGKTMEILKKKYDKTERKEDMIYVYDVKDSSEISDYLLENGIAVTYLKQKKIGLEDYYISMMEGRGEWNGKRIGI